MAAHMHVRGKWKDVKIDPNAFIKKDFSGFVCMQELTDYEIVRGVNKKRKDKAKKLINLKPSELTEEPHQRKKQLKKRLTLKKQNNQVDLSLKEANDDVDEGSTDEILDKSSNTKKRQKNKNHDNNDIEKSIDGGSKKRKCSASDSTFEKPKKKKKKTKKSQLSEDISTAEPDTDTCTSGTEPDADAPDMSAWKDLFVPDPVLKSLAMKGFMAPTPIQSLALAPAIRDKRDIVGAAETGSGKTLAFGIPIIHHILQLQSETNQPDVSSKSQRIKKQPIDDIITEDNTDEDSDSEIEAQDHSESELSDNEQQISEADYMNRFTEEMVDEDSSDADSRPLYALILTPTRELAVQVRDHLKAAAKHTDIQVVVVVGGMAPQKQTRLLKKCPEIVVATPGRLWEMLQEGEPHLSKVSDVKFLVIDEADRMAEKGHFQELTQLLQLINSDQEKKRRRQTFVFSATLTFVHAGPIRLKYKKKTVQMTEKQKLDSLMELIGVKAKPKVIDLTRAAGTAESLTEARINCTMDEKDIYMYYFLQQYPGRTLVFANSKDCIRRLTSIFKLLQCCPLTLHADMHQRQRLKNLDRFKGNPKALLLATDVAARGLDIPDVQHVIHYQVPRTTECYVHRSGRTARANKEGLSVMLVGPEDLQNYRKIIRSLNRDDDLPLFPVDQEFISGAKMRVSLARSIDTDEHRLKKQQYHNSWFQKAAREMEIELDENELLEDVGDEFEQSEKKRKLNNMKLELKSMLLQPSHNRSYGGKYPTKSGKLPVPSMKGPSESTAVSRTKDEQRKNKSLLSQVPKSKLNRKQKFKKKKKSSKT